LRLWDAYAEMLLGENFEDHPYWRALEESESVVDLVQPSTEHEQFHKMAGHVIAFYGQIRRYVPVDILGPRFAPGLYLKAHLCILSRVFGSEEYSSLVPVTDLANHTPTPGTSWNWEGKGEERMHVVRATRAHACGEEVCISYGLFSNVLLFRTYGFTLPPELEPCCSYVIQHTKPKDIYERFLPAEHSDMLIRFETNLVQDSLVNALNTCAEHGADPIEFVRALCKRGIEAYERDPFLRVPLAALARARKTTPTSAAWWTEMTEQHSDIYKSASAEVLGPNWVDAVLRVKMSEYLCLVVHLEAIDVATGILSEEECLALGSNIRPVIAQAIEMLKQGERVRLTMASAAEQEQRTREEECHGVA